MYLILHTNNNMSCHLHVFVSYLSYFHNHVGRGMLRWILENKALTNCNRWQFWNENKHCWNPHHRAPPVGVESQMNGVLEPDTPSHGVGEDSWELVAWKGVDKDTKMCVNCVWWLFVSELMKNYWNKSTFCILIMI